MIKLKLHTILFTALALTMFASCASNKDMPEVQEDSYEDSETEAIKLDSTKSKNKKNAKSKQNPNALPNQKNALEQLFTYGNKDDYVIMDTSSVFTEKVVGGIKQQKSKVVLDAKDTRNFGFGATYMAAYYFVIMDAENRNKISAAFDSYLSDFENKRLDRKNKKSLKQYAELNLKFRWGSTSISTPNNGSGKAYAGYEFVKNSPYFVISSYPVENEYYKIVGESTTRESLRLKFYFTKAQMKDLLSMISDEKITEIIKSYYSETFENQGIEDSYIDDDYEDDSDESDFEE